MHYRPIRCRRALPLAAASLLALAACQSRAPVVQVELVAPPKRSKGWRDVATATDAARLDGLGTLWSQALQSATRSGFTRQIKAAGPLLDSAAGLPRAMLPPGSYKCRTIRLGGPRGKAAFSAFKPFFCHVEDEGDLISLTKQTGAERPGGYLWEDGRARMVFLGATAVGSEKVPPAYAANPARDAVGVLERIGPFHWRLTMPRQRGAQLDVIELVPAVPPELTAGNQAAAPRA